MAKFLMFSVNTIKMEGTWNTIHDFTWKSRGNLNIFGLGNSNLATYLVGFQFRHTCMVRASELCVSDAYIEIEAFILFLSFFFPKRFRCFYFHKFHISLFLDFLSEESLFDFSLEKAVMPCRHISSCKVVISSPISSSHDKILKFSWLYKTKWWIQ